MMRTQLLLILPLLVSCTTVDQCDATRKQEKLDKLPGILAAYPDWGMCGEEVERAIESGVNVIVWFQGNMLGGTIEVGIDMACVERVVRKYPDVVSLLSIGGWNAPHIDPGHTADEYWAAFLRLGVFDGLDWDLEGNDTPAHPSNTFTPETLRLMAEVTTLAKQDGYLVFMAPPQSYLDPQTRVFSRSVVHPPDYGAHAAFTYHGRNVYAYLLAVCGIESIDAVSVQLYEGYSRAGYELSRSDPVGYPGVVVRTVRRYNVPFTVDFSLDPDPAISALGEQVLRVPPSKLLIGLANGWGSLPSPDTKFAFIPPDVVRSAYEVVPTRGFMFWSLKEEGRVSSGVLVTLSANLSWVVG